MCAIKKMTSTQVIPSTSIMPPPPLQSNLSKISIELPSILNANTPLHQNNTFTSIPTTSVVRSEKPPASLIPTKIGIIAQTPQLSSTSETSKLCNIFASTPSTSFVRSITPPASSILNDQFNYHNKPPPTKTPQLSSAPAALLRSETILISSNSELNSNKRLRKKWTNAEEICLISLYKKYKHDFDGTIVKNDDVWKKIASEMGEKHDDPATCKYKFQNLKMNYTNVRDHNNQTGNEPRYFRHMDLFEDLFSRAHATNPLSNIESIMPYSPPSSSISTISLTEDDLDINETMVPSILKKRKITIVETIKEIFQKNSEERKELETEYRLER